MDCSRDCAFEFNHMPRCVTSVPQRMAKAKLKIDIFGFGMIVGVLVAALSARFSLPQQ